jgi:hypothetical protein
MFEEEFEINNPDAIIAALVFEKEQEISSEIIKFSDLITAQNFKRTSLSSNDFCIDKKRDFPHRCTKILLEIVKNLKIITIFIGNFLKRYIL